MPESNWRQFCQTHGGLIAGIVIVAILAVVTLELALITQREIDNDAARNAAHYAEDAEGDIAAKCSGLSGQALDDCSDEIDNATREHQRGEYDLAAQQTMALWTAVMGGMAVLGVGLSSIGVYLIWQTWAETSRTANAAIAAQQLSTAEKRGFVHFRVRPAGGVADHEMGITIDVQYYGALNVGGISATLTIWKMVGEEKRALTYEATFNRQKIGGSLNAAINADSATIADDLANVREYFNDPNFHHRECNGWFIDLAYEYTDGFGERWKGQQTFCGYDRCTFNPDTKV